jgi:FkbM family methyltransferase
MQVRPAFAKFVRRRLPFLYNPLLAVYQRLFDVDTFRLRRHLKNAIAVMETEGGGLTFVQVGSNDGFANDPFCDWIVHSRTKAYFFEPVPSCYARLVSNYLNRVSPESQTRLHFSNEAVTEDGSDLIFFSVSDSAVLELGKSLPYWWDQLGSFDRSHITKHLDGILDPFIIETNVRTVSLRSFAEREKLASIDILHIDAEGHDFMVLQSLDLGKVQPRLILIEHKHLNPEDRAGLMELLSRWGYRSTQFQSDLVAQI